ncbi:MAG: hypothetical protein KDD44_05705 [Bdellovibrionales bacterium]|nr:hypothetical protein [Bdellovibrionales bacterium]
MDALQKQIRALARVFIICGLVTAGCRWPVQSADESSTSLLDDSVEQDAVHPGVYDCNDSSQLEISDAAHGLRLTAPEGTFHFQPCEAGYCSRSSTVSRAKGILYYRRSLQSVRTCRRNSFESVWHDARERGVWLRAVGSEPGWLVEIRRDGTIHLELDYGETVRTIPIDERAVDERSAVITGADAQGPVTIRAEKRRCTDSMRGDVHQLVVTVRLPRKSLRGCGRMD